jgi:arginine-tRNA-protein transferase
VIPETVKVYLSTAHECPYLAGEIASSLVVDPDLEVDRERLSFFTTHGFRRSGDIIYRPHCPDCRECVSVRVAAAAFRPNRSQRRVQRRNANLRVVQAPAEFRDEHFALYLSYQRYRHPDSDMCDADPEKYHQFLISGRYQSVFYEMYQDTELLAVAVTDELTDGISAVYTFFSPAVASRSLGTYAVLWEIEQARQRGLAWVYLGYWIRGCRKMSYKTGFQPIEGFLEGSWVSLER